MDDDDSSNKIIDLWTGILKKCLVLFKIQSHTILCHQLFAQFFWFLCITCMIFVVVKVKVREGQNFEFQIKNPNEKKFIWKWQLGGICIQKSNWVEYRA